MRHIRIGTSGWQYDHWKGVYYPDDLPKDKYLQHHAARFNSLEINASFYHLPDRTTFRRWAEETPDGFLFAVKANRYITHMKKLKHPEEPVGHLIEAAKGLGKKLGPILFQLPPRWHRNVGRLDCFLESLPSGLQYTFEFRDPTWFDDAVYETLSDHDVAFCIHDLDGRTSPKEITAGFVYIRLHGPNGPYKGEYGPRRLSGWAGAISAWADSQHRDVYCYFDNDQNAYAVRDAERLRDMLALQSR